MHYYVSACVSVLCISKYESVASCFGLQAEFGDHEPDQPRPLDNVSQLTFAPNQNKEMEEKILELHKSHRSEREQGHVVKCSQAQVYIRTAQLIENVLKSQYCNFQIVDFLKAKCV